MALAMAAIFDGVDVFLLVAIGVLGCVGRAGGGAPRIVVCDVCREERGGGRDVGGPAEPAGVSGVDVHRDAGEFELRDGVLDAFHVGGLGVGRAVIDAGPRCVDCAECKEGVLRPDNAG